MRFNPQAISKADAARALLASVDGATLDELMTLTGWRACTVRAWLTRQKQRGKKIVRAKTDSISRYHLEIA
jgi:hypothetical protein